MASVEALKERSKAQIDHRFGLKAWLNAAQKTRNLAEEADRKGDIEEAYVGYRKTINLVRAMLDLPELKDAQKKKASPEYFTYMDLKQKVLPTTNRMLELEKTLSSQEGREAHHRDTLGSNTGQAKVDSLQETAAFESGTPRTSTATTSGSRKEDTASISTNSRPLQMNGVTNTTSAMKAAPPPVPSTSTKPPVPSSSSKPAYATSTPTSPAQQHTTSPPTSPAPHGWSAIGATSHRVSSKLKERMAALHNAGMRDVSEYKADEHDTRHNGISHLDSSKPAAASPKLPTFTNGARNSPTLPPQEHPTYNNFSALNGASSTTVQPPPNGDFDSSYASTLPSAYSQEDMLDPWPPKTLSRKPSREEAKQALSPPRASPLNEDTKERPGSAPPASNGPPDASGPASTSEDWLTLSTHSASRPSRPTSMQHGNEHDDNAVEHLASGITELSTNEDLDSFAHRFPDIAHNPPAPTFPSISADAPGRAVTSHGGITRPFLPAPTSKETLQYQGQNVRLTRSETQSTVQTNSTGGSAGTGHRSSGSISSLANPPSVGKVAAAGLALSKPPRPLPKPPAVPSLPNRTTTTITPQELWAFLESPGTPGFPTVLLIDVRTRKDYSAGHIKGNVVCIEPFTITSNSTAFSIENSLIVSPENERKWFADRASFDLVVMYDRHTTTLPSRTSTSSPSFGARNGPVTFRSIAEQAEEGAANAKALSTLSSAIYELNFADEHKRLRRSPLLLVGGFEAWMKQIGEKGCQRETYTQPQLHHYHRHHQSNGHEHHSTPPLEPTRPDQQPQQKTKYEEEYQTMLANRAQAESALASKAPIETAETSQDVKRQHRKAVVSGSNGVVAPTGQQMPAQPSSMAPSGYYPGIAMPPVAVHRTGPASPYEAYPSTPFQSRPFPQIHQQAEYFNGNSSPQRNGLPYSTEQSNLPYTGQPIEYPTLQQRQQFGSPSSRPNPTMPTDAVTHVQRPPPALARAPSSSLHLYQSGDYLKNPTFGAFPKQLVALGDGVVGLTGLKNLGNTCYMNSMIQCLSATIPLARFFKEGSYKRAINRANPLGTKGVLADAVAQLIQSLWSEQYRFLAPVTFREAICRFAPQFKGSDQHDSQEFLAFMLDGLHEDLNLVINKPPPIEFTPEREKELETLPTQIAAEREWNIYLRRDDSIIVRLLQGQYKSQLRCLTCGTTSTTYNTFMYLSLPIPAGRGVKEVTLSQCIDFFTQPETLDGSDAWNCPKCKQPRRATKALTISRLPPILLIHLKRFSFQGPFTDKIDTAVIFPVRGLDLARHLPPPLSPHIKAKYEHAVGHSLDEPTSQLYDLHAVSNHFGNLSSGHYTAYVRSRGHWHDINDSKVGPLSEAQVASANKSAYTLWYSRRAGQ